MRNKRWAGRLHGCSSSHGSCWCEALRGSSGGADLLRIVFRTALQGRTIVVIAALIVAVGAAPAGAAQSWTIVVAVIVELVLVLDLREARLNAFELRRIEHVLGPRRQDF